MDQGEFKQYKADYQVLSDKIGNLEIGFARLDERLKNFDEKIDRFLRGVQVEFVTMSRFNAHVAEMEPIKKAYEQFQAKLVGYVTTSVIIAIAISSLLLPWAKDHLIK